MNYTDKELLRASQIAYYTIDEEVIDDVRQWIDKENNVSGNNISPSYSLSEIYNISQKFRDSIYDSLSATCGFTVTENDTREKVLGSEVLKDDEAKKVAVSAVFDIIDELQSDKEGSIGSWKLVSYVFNDDIGVKGVAGKLVDGAWVTDEEFSSSGDGLCAYVFETSEDSAIVAFRGSEPITSWKTLFSDDFKSDWISADGGLALNDEDTLQQQSVYQYINNYVNSLGYDNYAFAA